MNGRSLDCVCPNTDCVAGILLFVLCNQINMLSAVDNQMMGDADDFTLVL